MVVFNGEFGKENRISIRLVTGNEEQYKTLINYGTECYWECTEGDRNWGKTYP